MQYRTATTADAEAIASLHAKSWRKNYRGALSDHFLDQEVAAERRALWKARFAEPAPKRRVILAESEARLAGFICLELDADPHYGAMLDNLHVDQDQQGKGIGKTLMRLGAEWVVDQRRASGIYLFVLLQNEQAARVYERTGGLLSSEKLFWEMGGKKVPTRRYFWKNAEDLYSGASQAFF